MKKEYIKFILLIILFGAFYFVPMDFLSADNAIAAGFLTLQDYAQKHVLLCLVPAFFIAGGIAVYAKKEAVLKLLGAKTPKWISYPVASVSGGVLAVCSCTILPLFAGIWKRGAGIGPATAFLYAGPAINVAAIFLTGTVLGWEMSFVRLAFSIVGAIIIGLIMGSIFKEQGISELVENDENESSFSKVWVLLFFMFQLAFLIVGGLKITPVTKVSLLISFVLVLIYIIFVKFDKEHNKEWIGEVWFFTKKILPYLFAGVFIAGVISQALPEEVVNTLLGGNRIFSNFFASVFGALMYFATLTEVPIIQSLMTLGMGKGPALALFLAGYSLSLPNMIVLTKLLGWKKAFTYIALIIVYSSLAGFVYGNYMFI
ncbi:MAG: permease [Candidatus Delongbacteria bacterium]|nr:permease [Candidatus Delongbacteria bacterium]